MITGTDRIRERLVHAQKAGRLARFSAEVGISPTETEAFIACKSIPSAKTLIAMTDYFWSHARFDAERNVLIAGGKAAQKATLPSYPRHGTPDPNWVKREYTGVTQLLPSLLAGAWKGDHDGWA